jgi:hypothetical protein
MALYGGIAKIEPSRGISKHYHNINEIQEGKDGVSARFANQVLRKR